MVRSTGGVSVRVVWLLSDADLGATDDELRNLKADPGKREVFRTAWAKRMFETEENRLAMLTASADQGRYETAPVANLLDRSSKLWDFIGQRTAGAAESEDGLEVGLSVCCTPDFNEAVKIWAKAVAQECASRGVSLRTSVVEIPEFSLEATRRALGDHLEEVAKEDADAPLIRPLAAGSNELNVGLLVACLESGRDFALLDLIGSSVVRHEVNPNPMAWLLRRRYFSAAADIEMDNFRRERLQKLEWSKDLYDVPAVAASRTSLLGGGDPASVTVAFDHVASRAVQSVLMLRKALSDEGLEVGSKAKESIRRHTPFGWLVFTADSTVEKPRVSDVGKRLRAIGDLATPNGRGPHPLKPLPLHRARQLRAWDDVRCDPRVRLAGYSELIPFRATPSGRVLVLRGVGLREFGKDGHLVESPFDSGLDGAFLRQVLADFSGVGHDNARDQIKWGSANHEYSVDVLLGATCESRPHADRVAGCSPGWKRQHAVDLSRPDDVDAVREAFQLAATMYCGAAPPDPPDLIIALVGPGRLNTQLGLLLAASDLGQQIAAPVAVGVMRAVPGDPSRTLMSVADAAIVPFPGWHRGLGPLVRQLVEELELPGAMEALVAAGMRGAILHQRIEALWQELSGNVSRGYSQKQAATLAAERVALVSSALSTRDPFLSAQWAANAVELAVGPKSHKDRAPVPHPDLWKIASLKALFQVRNQSPMSHGGWPEDMGTIVKSSMERFGLSNGGQGDWTIEELLSQVVRDLMRVCVAAKSRSTASDRLKDCWVKILDEVDVQWPR